MKQKYYIEGMTCSACQMTIENTIKDLGVDKVNVSLLTNSMEVDSSISEKEIIDAVSKAGYKAISRKEDSYRTKTVSPKEIYERQLKDIKNSLNLSIPLMIILMYIAMGEMVRLPLPSFLQGYEGAGNFVLVQFLLSIGIYYANRNYFVSGFRALFNKNPNMDSLVALGASAAFVYGIFAMFMINYGLGNGYVNLVMEYRHDLYFESGAMILTLISLGNYLEVRSKNKTTESINKLIEMQPNTVRLIRDGKEEIIDLVDVKVGDTLKIIPGERLAIDGVIVEGNSSIDTSAITGESLPIDVKKGDRVVSGSVNTIGSFLMEVRSVGSNTTISKIIDLMEEASASKAAISKLADKISSIFVPIAILLSLLSFIGWLILGSSFTFAFSTGIAVLVISCPCALGLATPVAMMVANGKAADHGILVKNAEALEVLSQVDTIVYDKTGTITKGETVLTDLISINNIDPDWALAIAKSLESNSQHPLALAIINYAEERNIKGFDISNFKSITGMGVEAEINKKKYYIGNSKLMKEVGVYDKDFEKIGDKYTSQGKTCVFLFDDTNLLALFAIADPIKTSSIEAIKDLSNMKIKTIMLTGDNEKTASYIAGLVGVDEFKADLLPQDKDKVISDLQTRGRKVAMVGDGINDGPSLLRADVGIAIGAGTDIAIESADLVLIKSNLKDIVSTIKLSEATLKTIKQNLFWAFFYNIIAIPLAMGVFYPSFGIKLNPMIGALAMSLSSIFVVTNSLRLNKFKIDDKSDRSENFEIRPVNYDNINIIEETKIQEENIMEVKSLKIEGMSCTHCKAAVEKALSKFSDDIEVSLVDNMAKIKLDNQVSDEELREAVSKAGYKLVSVS